MAKYMWKDIVKVNGKLYAEEFEITGIVDDEDFYEIDEYIQAVADKHGVKFEEVETYMMNDIVVNPYGLPYTVDECGCYIDGVGEWFL